MANRPTGRKKNITGRAKSAPRRTGKGLGTGRVGKSDGYSKRRKKS